MSGTWLRNACVSCTTNETKTYRITNGPLEMHILHSEFCYFKYRRQALMWLFSFNNSDNSYSSYNSVNIFEFVILTEKVVILNK